MTEPLSKIRRVNVVKRPVMRPPPVPLAHGFGGEKEVCIRECYDKYCEIVEAQSNKNKRCVTVTGTPGKRLVRAEKNSISQSC